MARLNDKTRNYVLEAMIARVIEGYYSEGMNVKEIYAKMLPHRILPQFKGFIKVTIKAYERRQIKI